MKTLTIVAGILICLIGCDSPVQDIEPVKDDSPIIYGNILDSLQGKTYVYDYQKHNKNDGLTRHRHAYEFKGDSVTLTTAEKYYNTGSYHITYTRVMKNMAPTDDNLNNISVNGSAARSTLYITYWGDSIGFGTRGTDEIHQILHLIE